jgi:antitoxin ParD1/3/4
MNISLPETLKRFVQERTKGANYSNPSDYVRSLIREDQRRLAATSLLDDMVAKHLAANPTATPAKLEKLRAEFWSRWNELKSDIDAGLASLDRDGGKALDTNLVSDIKSRARKKLASAKTV